MISQYKAYIHAELLPSRTEASLGAAFTRTYQFFKDLGHQILVQFQVLLVDNECPESLVRFFKQQRVTLERVPPTQKRDPDISEPLSLDSCGYPSKLPHQPVAPSSAPVGSNPQHYALLARQHDHLGVHRRPYDFLSHRMVPCGTLLVVHDPGSAKWDIHGRIGFYLGPALTHYRAYHCFIADTNATRICDSVMFYPPPLVLPGASRFDQLLQLTKRLVTAAEPNRPASHNQPLYARRMPTKDQGIPSRRRSQRSRAHAFTQRCASHIHPSPPEHRYRNRLGRIQLHGPRVRTM
jgi:hypothetical protein